MAKMTLRKRIGLFHVDITGFKTDSLPFPEKILEAVGRHLPVIAAKRNDVLLNVIKVWQTGCTLLNCIKTTSYVFGNVMKSCPLCIPSWWIHYKKFFHTYPGKAHVWLITSLKCSFVKSIWNLQQNAYKTVGHSQRLLN